MEHIRIDEKLIIHIPESLKTIPQFNHNVQTYTIDCPRYTQNGEDMLEMVPFISVEKKGIKEPLATACSTPIKDETDDNIIHFNWTIKREVTDTVGKIGIVVCVRRSEEENLENAWHTYRNEEIEIKKGIDCGLDMMMQYPGLIEEMLYRLGIVEKTGGAVTDETLTISGAPADSKVVGDKFGKLSETVNDVKRDISLNTDRSKFNRATVDKFNGIFKSKFVNVLEYNKLDIITMLDYSKANFLGMYKLLDICPTKTDLDENGISFTYSAIDDHVSETTITIPESEMHEDTGILIGIEAESETPVFAVVPENGVVIEGEFIECGFYARLITDEVFLSKVDFGAYDLILYRLKDDMVTEEQLEEAVNDALTQAKESGEFNGKDGYTPIKGTDYFTESDKTEFVEDILNALPTWTGGSY